MAINTGLASPNFRALIRSQHGVVSAAQAVAYGLSRETTRRRVENGIWQRPLPGVLALQSGPPNRLQWLIAAQLYAGEGSVLTGRAALSVYGLEDGGRIGADGEGRGADTLHALVPHRTRRRNLAHVRITRTTRVPQPNRFGELRVAPPARSVLDCCLAADEDGQAEVIDRILASALADGRVLLTELEHELDEAPRRHSGRVRSALAGARDHARAAASEVLLNRLDAVGPFGALRDVTVYYGRGRVARAAALWPTRAVAVVVDAPEQEIRTLAILGFAVIPLTTQRIECDLADVLRQVGGVLTDRPDATLPAGVSLLPLATAHAGSISPQSARSALLPAHPDSPPEFITELAPRPSQLSRRVLMAVSPARTGVSSLLPLGGTGHTK
jgi:hypothetical protein